MSNYKFVFIKKGKINCLVWLTLFNRYSCEHFECFVHPRARVLMQTHCCVLYSFSSSCHVTPGGYFICDACDKGYTGVHCER